MPIVHSFRFLCGLATFLCSHSSFFFTSGLTHVCYRTPTFLICLSWSFWCRTSGLSKKMSGVWVQLFKGGLKYVLVIHKVIYLSDLCHHFRIIGGKNFLPFMRGGCAVTPLSWQRYCLPGHNFFGILFHILVGLAENFFMYTRPWLRLGNISINPSVINLEMHAYASWPGPCVHKSKSGAVAALNGNLIYSQHVHFPYRTLICNNWQFIFYLSWARLDSA